MEFNMKADFECFCMGKGLYIVVHNYSSLNEVGHYHYTDKQHTEKDYCRATVNLNIIGRWIPKTIKK